MFDQIFEGVRKASESSLQMQQELFKYWTQQWSQAPVPGGVVPSGVVPGGISPEWGRNVQKRWLDLVVEVLNRHRESIDSTYRTGIQIIEQTFHVSEAKSSEDYRRMVEDLWRKLFESMKAQTENQFHDFQKFSEKSAEIMQNGRST